jgi:type I restriction enzyme R subunit
MVGVHFVGGTAVIKVEMTSEAFVFPRYHQLDVVRQVLTAVHREGAGHSYLIQHSAGSGKSNSIAWLAHQLANLYQKPTDKERLFDSIIVVTDRRVLDSQLQNTIKQFEQTAGVVVPIDKDSQQLKKALQDGKAIIITTLQKFPVISATTSALKGKKFAVIIDEAHSSQSGESAKHLKQALSPDMPQEGEHGGLPPQDADDEFDIEDAIVEEIRLRGRQDHISYFAFTATPKNKTLELFGRQTPDGEFVAFHNYWMRQAIEERFILDVLKNYTTFERYFKLVKKIEADQEYEKQKALTLLKSHVDLQPHAIEMKTRIMLDHFVSVTAKAIQGRGRAMVVTQSKEAAIRYWQAFRQQMAERNLPYKALVAFTGKVKDAAAEEYTEAKANKLPAKVSIPDAFKTPAYRILIVVDKFQTGFDEPLLHTMYVDKKLRDVNAVQTLSRLNRTLWSKGKNDTVVLDFVNTADDIQKAFQPYYQTTLLEQETDPDKLYDLQHDLEKVEVYTDEDVAAFADIFYNPKEAAEKLQPILDRVVNAWKQKTREERETFRSTLRKYIRFYGFVCQLLTFADTDLEKLYAFARHLNRKLPRRDNRLPYEIRDAVDLDSFRIEETYKGSIALLEQDSAVAGLSASPETAVEDEQEHLSIIIELLNETYGINITDDDKIDLSHMKQKLFLHDELEAVMTADNSLTNMEAKFSQLFDQMLLEFVHNKLDLYKKLSEPNVNQQLKRHWFDGAFRQFHGGSR